MRAMSVRGTSVRGGKVRVLVRDNNFSFPVFICVNEGNWKGHQNSPQLVNSASSSCPQGELEQGLERILCRPFNHPQPSEKADLLLWVVVLLKPF